MQLVITSFALEAHSLTGTGVFLKSINLKNYQHFMKKIYIIKCSLLS